MPPQQRGTGFTNLQQWLGLNQGAAQSLGGGLAGDVESKGEDYKRALQSAGSQFYGQLGASGMTPPPGQLTAAQASELGQQQWKGPAGLDSAAVADLTARAQAAQNAAGALGSATGRQALLAQKYGPNTWGGGALDAALAGAGQAGGRLRETQGAYGKLLESLGQSQEAARGEAAKYKSDFERGAKYYREQVPGLQQQETQARRERTKGVLQSEAEQRQEKARRRIDERYTSEPRQYIP